MSLDDVLALAGTQLWQLTALIALVAVVARRVARRRPHLAHVLWLVVLVKCVTPPIVSSPVGVFSRLQPVRDLTVDAEDALPVVALPESSNDERVATIAPGEVREAIEESSTEIAALALDGVSIDGSPARVLPSPLEGEGSGMRGQPARDVTSTRKSLDTTIRVPCRNQRPRERRG